MEATTAYLTLALTGLLSLERLFKNCSNFNSCSGLRHATFQCSKCLTAEMDFKSPANSPSMSAATVLSLPTTNERKSNRRLSIDELCDIMEKKIIP